MDRDLKLEPPYLIIRPGFSEEDFYRLANEDSDWEYLAGRIVMHSPASYRHEDLFSFLLTLIRNYLDEKGGATVLGSRYPMRLDANWSPEPDLLVVRKERKDRLKKKFLDGPADLAIEIVSESDPMIIDREKLPRYREAEIPEVWIVDPFRKEVLQETPSPVGAKSLVLSTGRLESTVIPGFWLDVGWLWQPERPSTVASFKKILAAPRRRPQRPAARRRRRPAR